MVINCGENIVAKKNPKTKLLPIVLYLQTFFHILVGSIVYIWD